MWLEELPDKCPPDDAEKRDLIAFRMVKTIPPLIDDFYSYSYNKIIPKKVFNIDECTLRACSVFCDLEECREKLKYKNHKDKKIVKVSITKKDGVIKKTLSSKSHHSWWISSNFKPTSNNTEEINE